MYLLAITSKCTSCTLVCNSVRFWCKVYLSCILFHSCTERKPCLHGIKWQTDSDKFIYPYSNGGSRANNFVNLFRNYVIRAVLLDSNLLSFSVIIEQLQLNFKIDKLSCYLIKTSMQIELYICISFFRQSCCTISKWSLNFNRDLLV